MAIITTLGPEFQDGTERAPIIRTPVMAGPYVVGYISEFVAPDNEPPVSVWAARSTLTGLGTGGLADKDAGAEYVEAQTVHFFRKALAHVK